jgi:hypothetical protein
VHALQALPEHPYGQLFDDDTAPLAPHITSELPWHSVALGVHALQAPFAQP